ncbi:methyltransferase domain-containing protein [Nocardia sp. CDC153]|uniref:class I SAM-dependent methyltransferase n=1 Tax=Nocardia sp. CDC153 TaxID=3112167 RepID=UPI002DB676A6|nr:methyltransferase domain-containing protein [Nocardia sp. CDC153]MEC3957220.1 methyltransferase domain-containing protein [Nocardia sp. CDC153]
MNPIVARVMSTVAGQLGNPHGVLGKGVARFLNRGNRPMIAAAVAAAEVGPVDAAADIGFGGGIGLTLLLERVGTTGTVTGVELSPDMLTRARSEFADDLTSGRLKVVEGSLTGLPLPDDSLDAVITCNTVYFVPDLDAACAELARVLRPKGRLVVGIGDPDAMARMPFTPYGFTLRPVADVTAAMERAGLTVEHRDLPHKPIPGHLLIGRPA